MFTYGGRIGFDEYNRWILWVLEQEKGKAA
jgi:hypothetical protein